MDIKDQKSINAITQIFEAVRAIGSKDFEKNLNQWKEVANQASEDLAEAQQAQKDAAGALNEARKLMAAATAKETEATELMNVALAKNEQALNEKAEAERSILQADAKLAKATAATIEVARKEESLTVKIDAFIAESSQKKAELDTREAALAAREAKFREAMS